MDDNFSSHKFAVNRVNFSILIPPVILSILGIATFYSIDAHIFNQQLMYLFASLFAYFVFLNINYRIFIVYAKYMYWVMIFLLLLLFFIGLEARGSVRWIDVFGIRIQFSEVIKPFFIIFFATHLTQNSSRSIGKFLKSLLFVVPFFFLILKQPDLGNALIYIFVSLGMMFVYGFPWRYFLTLALLAILPFPLVFNFLHDYQKARLMTFIDVTSDPTGTSYNAIQALISIGSGGFFGKGLGQATQSILQFLPERHTDFIFATISESLGFVGGAFIIGLFAFFLFTLYMRSQQVHDELSHTIVIGFFFLFLTHVFVNIGMNIGLVPIVGITLPFVSYGGSSLLTNFIALGILSSLLFEFNKRRTMEIR